MSLSMLGFVDPTFGTGQITITKSSGGYVNGKWVDDGNAVPTTHFAIKQFANSEELRALADGGERYTEVASFFINDGSMHDVGAVVVDQHGNTYRVVDADSRPERNYCKLLAASLND